MGISEICEHFRVKHEPLRVDSVTIDTGQELFRAHGTILTGKSQFSLLLTIHNGECPLTTGSLAEDQNWKISGFIDDEVAFTTEGRPHSTSTGYNDQAYSRAKFYVHSLTFGKELSAEELVAKQTHIDEIVKLMPALQRGHIVADPALIPQEEPLRILCEARLIKFPLIWKNEAMKIEREGPLKSKSTNSSLGAFHVCFGECDFVLTQEDEDCLITISPEKNCAVSAEELERILNAFLTALAFVSGQDAWPQEVKFRTRYRTLKHTITVPRDTRRSRSPLLTETACANGADFGSILGQATLFFLNQKELGDTARELIYLARSATSSQTPYEVGILAICSIFEGLVDLLDSHLLKGEEHGDEAVFNEAKGTLLLTCNSLKASVSPEETTKIRSYERLAGSIGSARFARFKEKLPRLVAHLGLQWEGYFCHAASDWHNNRNTSAHGGLASQRRFDLKSQSRMAGAINILVAASVGYKGLAVFSSAEDRYYRI